LSKKYLFTNDSYYDSPGCSCCDSYLVEVYNSNDTDCNLGSAHSYEHCYYQAILTELGVESVTESYQESLYCAHISDLKEIAKDLNIKVRIVS
jgi:hypothetical protein